MKDKTTKRRGVAAKLIPATCMLLVSATALVSSTYAWFTMSREVEVKNIKMTATVPSDLQISLGEIVSHADGTAVGDGTYNLAASTGVLKVDNGAVVNPADQDDDDPYDWSNTADISAYYDFGKLMPAGSTNGTNVFFTPDAAGLGRDLKDGAASYQAATNLIPSAESTAGTGGGSGNLNTTAHVYTSSEKSDANTHTWTTTGDTKYTPASSWNNTNSDGYYVDIPIWLRTSSTTDKDVYVTGYIKDGSNDAATSDSDSDELYKAVRVAILTTETGEGVTTNKGCIDLVGFASDVTPSYPANTLASGTSLIDSAIANSTQGFDSGIHALKATGSLAATNKNTTYGTVDINTAVSDKKIGTLVAKTTAQYGAEKKFVIRVWLEGDDTNCWNPNAGQDWSISLKFMTDPLTASGG